MGTLFVSDLHLCPEREAANLLFETFLDGPARGAQALYILGDLFEYWAGDDDLSAPFNRRICSALRGLSASVPTYFMAGNRDFLIGEDFAELAGVGLLGDTEQVILHGVRTLLMHGDTLCTEDIAYQDFRAQVRSPGWRTEFLALPLDVRKARIEALRRLSEREKGGKSMQIMDADAHEVVRALREHACRRLIHGHTHRPARHRYEIAGDRCERWVLPDWYAGGGYLSCDAGGCRLVKLQSPRS
jgi:UDP-2,3-diacylglucosamine hydrolase